MKIVDVQEDIVEQVEIQDNVVSEVEELFRELEVRNVMLITDEFLRKAIAENPMKAKIKSDFIDKIAKIIVQVIVTILKYILSKIFVFKKNNN